MGGTPRIFVDSDVVISSLISSSGAAYLLLHQPNLSLFISNFSYQEMKIVVARLGLKGKTLEGLAGKRFKITKLEESKVWKEEFGGYVTDVNDAHIIAGTVKAKAKFLISYNLWHFKVEKIKVDLGILLFTPARYLQYLRSL